MGSFDLLIEASAYGSALPRDRCYLKAPEAKGIRREDIQKKARIPE